MRSFMVVFVLPVLDTLADTGHRQEPAGIEAFRASTAIEGLNVSVVCRRSGSAEVELDPVQIGLPVEHAPGEFGPIVHPDASRPAALAHQVLQHLTTW